jgi:predicted Zn-dependent peptidase
MPTVTRLDSGLTVATEVMPHIETASVSVVVNAGSRQERIEESGIAHVLEHMAFKGTARRTAVEIKEAIASVGGFISASTSANHTLYGARMLAADVPLALDVLSDIVINPTFDPVELAREEEVIVQEISSRQDNPNAFVFERLLEKAFPDQPLGRSIAGTVSNVRSFTPESLTAFRARTYHAPNVLVVAAGAVDHAAIVAAARDQFASLPTAPVKAPAPGRFSPGVVANERGIEQIHLAIALPGLPQTHPQRRSLQIFTHILGGDMSSRLFHQVREKRGLVYAVGSSHWEWSDTGLFIIYAATDAERIANLIEVLSQETIATTANITPPEVARAKAQFKSGVLMSLETAEGRAGNLAGELLTYGRPIGLQEFIADVDKVTVESVREAGRALLAASRPAVAILGPRGALDRAATVDKLFVH